MNTVYAEIQLYRICTSKKIFWIIEEESDMVKGVKTTGGVILEQELPSNLKKTSKAFSKIS